MEHGKNELPVYIYVEEHGNGARHHFEGDFCKGRMPTKQELKIFSERRILNIGSMHFIEGLRNPIDAIEIIGKQTMDKGSFSFPTLDSLINRAIEVYTSEGYKSGLILGFMGKTPLLDKVLIIGEGDYENEADFLRKAKKNNMWVAMLKHSN